MAAPSSQRIRAIAQRDSLIFQYLYLAYVEVTFLSWNSDPSCFQSHSLALLTGSYCGWVSPTVSTRVFSHPGRFMFIASGFSQDLSSEHLSLLSALLILPKKIRYLVQLQRYAWIVHWARDTILHLESWVENRFQSWCGRGRIQPRVADWFIDPAYNQNLKLNGFRPLHLGNALF